MSKKNNIKVYEEMTYKNKRKFTITVDKDSIKKNKPFVHSTICVYFSLENYEYRDFNCYDKVVKVEFSYRELQALVGAEKFARMQKPIYGTCRVVKWYGIEYDETKSIVYQCDLDYTRWKDHQYLNMYLQFNYRTAIIDKTNAKGIIIRDGDVSNDNIFISDSKNLYNALKYALSCLEKSKSNQSIKIHG